MQQTFKAKIFSQLNELFIYGESWMVRFHVSMF